MEFSFEVPLKQAEALDVEQDYLFVLAQCLEDVDYLRYVKNSPKKKILDNGANEQDAVVGRKLLGYAEIIDADIVIIPDKQFDEAQSLKYLFEFYSKYLVGNEYNYTFMVVPQSNTFEGMTRYLDMLSLLISRIEVLSNNITTIGLQFKFLRKFGMDFVNQTIPKIRPKNLDLHFLGFAKEDQLGYKQVKTMDTSLPINFAAENNELRFDRFPKGIDVWKDVVNEELAIENMRLFKRHSKIVEEWMKLYKYDS